MPILRSAAQFSSGFEGCIQIDMKESGHTLVTLFLSSNLKEHMESIHLNEKRHICTICGKAFNRRGNLKLHTFTHTRHATAFEVQSDVLKLFINKLH